MSEDRVYPLGVPSFLSGGCWVRSCPFQIQFWESRWPVVAFVVVAEWSKWSKIGLQEFQIFPEVRAYYAESRLYRISEDGVYSSSVPSCPFWGMSSSKRPVPDPIFAGSRCPVIELECFLVWSNWSKIGLEIPNPSRNLNLGWGFQVFNIWVRLKTIQVENYPSSVPSCLYLMDVEFEAAYSRSNYGKVDVAV